MSVEEGKRKETGKGNDPVSEKLLEDIRMQSLWKELPEAQNLPFLARNVY